MVYHTYQIDIYKKYQFFWYTKILVRYSTVPYVFNTVMICTFKILSIFDIYTEIPKQGIFWYFNKNHVLVFQFGIPQFRYETVYQNFGMYQYRYRLKIWYTKISIHYRQVFLY